MADITLTGRKVTITDAMRASVEDKIGGALKVFDISPMTCDVVIRVDGNRSNQDRKACEVTVYVRDNVVRVVSSGTDIDACIELAKETGIPMIGVWSREGCAHCKILEHAIMSDVFREWIKKSGLILGFSTSLDSATLSGADQATRAKHYPGVVFDEG
ncbi:MAG: ribosome-associated translation inhibitor RaiA, partial [Eggerthellaceae bacterium]|nr:ribosome-associated translation inhibitor RaiA [Eggerthellaceae bacterium]